MLTVNVDLSQVKKLFKDAPGKARAISARILTSAAFDINADIKTAMQRTFRGGATPYSLRAFNVIKATPESLESRVSLSTDPNKGTAPNRALEHLFSGGSRAWKRMEGAFVNKGLVARGYAIVPGAGCPLDAFGNVPASFVVQIMAYFGAFGEQGYKANMSEKGRKSFNKRQTSRAKEKTEFFISRGKGIFSGARSWQQGRSQNLPYGIWKRSGFGHGSSVKPIFLFVKRGTYGKVIDLEQVLKNYQTTKFMPMVGRHLKSILEA